MHHKHVMNAPPPPAIAIEHLSLTFGARTVLRDFCLEVHSGETVVLTGPSGGGKSSILACILGFLIPPHGRISIEGTQLTHDSVWPLRRSFALVPQEPDLGNDTVRAWHDELMVLDANADATADTDRLPAELRHLGLDPEILDRRAADISGGEKQRIALATALQLQRPILLLDEPTSALDADSRARVCSRLRELQDTTILIVSHHGNLELADRTVSLHSPEDNHGPD